MRLRNKKTGEIGNLVLNINPNRESYSVLSTENGDTVCGNLVIADYNSLAELNEEWCDYEEPKEYWYIDWNGEVCRSDIHDERTEQMKLIGNYFDTKEEAEKALKKLKAFKRLKDNGMIKYSFHKEKTGIDLDFYTLIILAPRDKDSLDLLFGVEE